MKLLPMLAQSKRRIATSAGPSDQSESADPDEVTDLGTDTTAIPIQPHDPK